MEAPLSVARSLLGALFLDGPRTLLHLRPTRMGERGAPWTRVRNRHERLESGPFGFGQRCTWEWTSDLHVAAAFPWVGRSILRRALETWPITFQVRPPSAADPPHVSFLIGHRGTARQEHLLMTLASVAAQEGANVECLVVEQSPAAEVRELLPSWVRYHHTPFPAELPYNRSWALNVGARLARAPLVVLHDNDMLIPTGYAAELRARYETGFEVMNLKRLVFYLGEQETRRALADRRLVAGLDPERVVQNLEAGGSVAISRSGLEAIGGLDEGFSGWGGEDNEFWERAQTLRCWSWGYLPLVHLWHPAQPEKVAGAPAPGRERYRTQARVPVEQRVALLREADWGRLDGPRRPAA